MKLLASQLEQTDIIEAAYIRSTTVQAVYKTGINEVYYYKVKNRKKKRGDNCFVVSPRSAAIRQELQTFKEYHDDPLDDSPTYHWCINRNQFNEATLMEKRIAMHHLLREVLNTKPEPDSYPIQILAHDWISLQDTKFDKYLLNGAITCFPRGRVSPHFRILEHFFNPGANHRGKTLWAALRLVCNKKRIRINSTNIRKIARWLTRRRIISPLVYCALFDALKITGPVGDLHPGYGSKALACAMMGLPYYTIKDDRFKRALDLGFSSFTRTEFGDLEDQKIELLISDNNFKKFEMPSADMLNNTTRMLCYAPRDERQSLIEQSKPTSVLQIYDHAVDAKTFSKSNYLLLW
ncbi:MAG: hypothetical protein M0R50_03245 [Candidatus Cloacimonetes bacterium]|nr:hypothetical protein [Candidatus Cloacimonadota bacterium]